MDGIGAEGVGGTTCLLPLPNISLTMPIQFMIVSWFWFIQPNVCTAPSFICCIVVGCCTSNVGKSSMSFIKNEYKRSALSTSPLHVYRQLIFNATLLVGLMFCIISFFILLRLKNIKHGVMENLEKGEEKINSPIPFHSFLLAVAAVSGRASAILLRYQCYLLRASCELSSQSTTQ